MELIIKLQLVAWCALLLLSLNMVTLTSANAVTFSIGDVEAELQTWGTVSFERINDTVDLDYSRVTLRVSEVSVLDDAEAVLASHPFKMDHQEFTIDKWEGDKFMGLKCAARRLVSGPLGDLSGFMDLFVYLFTEGGPVEFIKDDYSQTVKVDDAFVVIKLDNVTNCKVCHKAAFVDLRIEFTTKSPLGTKEIVQDRKGSALNIVHLPASSGVFLGNIATIDGARKEVVQGFPEVEHGSDKTEVIVRFPAFSSAASYGLFVRQDRRTIEQAKKENRTLGAIVENSAGHNSLCFKSFLMWVLCFTCFAFVRLV